MRVAFDVSPLLGGHLTGIGYCEVGQILALSEAHPKDEFLLQFFSRKSEESMIAKLQPYIRENMQPQYRQGSTLLYRTLSSILPIPYSHFFGDKAQVTHFFNYILPPHVAGKKIVTVHDMVYKTFPETVRGRTKLNLQLGLKKSLKRADIIVTDSEFSKQEIIRYFPKYADKIRVVYCGVNRERFYPVHDQAKIQAAKDKFQLEKDYFLYLGTVEPRKNLERLITAYDLFTKKVPDAPLLVLAGGKGWLDSGIYEKVQQLHLEDKVRFTSYVPEEDLCPLMCGALAFVFPSIYEGFGMPPLEAMSCGVPVLTSTAASLPEVVGDAAVSVDCYDTQAIADGLEKLWKNPELRKELSVAGLKRAETFTWERSAEQLYAVYQEALQG